jgi:glycerol-1-phosphate dehydrogenase [NAD(P)+]
MAKIDPIYVGKDAPAQLVAYLQARGLNNLTLVADENTYRALGERVEAAVKAAGLASETIVLRGKEIVADANYIMEVLVNSTPGDRTYVSVGSGTLTDITRYVSFRTRNPFISMPTAPSVDGFTSIGAPLVVGGVKRTFISQAPLAVFADLDTLFNAPQPLIAAGFGDVVAKITALADWKIGCLLWNEPDDADIERRTKAMVAGCVSHAEAIGRRDPEGVRVLMDSLIESGLCMLDFGSSRPASGAEHHASHYWEMKLLQEGRQALLHGAKVGYATIRSAERFEQLRNMSRAEALERLEGATLPPREAEIAHIREGYGDLADEVVREQAAFLDLTEADYDRIKHSIVENWDRIQEIAAIVPPPAEIAEMLRKAGAPTDWQTLGLRDEAEVDAGLEYGHYLRNRFTHVKLGRVLGMMN